MAEFLSFISPYFSFIILYLLLNLLFKVFLFVCAIRFLILLPRDISRIAHRLDTIDENIFVISEKDS